MCFAFGKELLDREELKGLLYGDMILVMILIRKKDRDIFNVYLWWFKIIVKLV